MITIDDRRSQGPEGLFESLAVEIDTLPLGLSLSIVLSDDPTELTKLFPNSVSHLHLGILEIGSLLICGPMRATVEDSCLNCFCLNVYQRHVLDLRALDGKSVNWSPTLVRDFVKLINIILLAYSSFHRPVGVIDSNQLRTRLFADDHRNALCELHLDGIATYSNEEMRKGLENDDYLSEQQEHESAAWQLATGFRSIIEPRPLQFSAGNPLRRLAAGFHTFAGWRRRTNELPEIASASDRLARRAYVKAVMEGVERWCLEIKGSEPCILEEYSRLEEAYDPAHFHLYSEEQYSTSEFPYRRYTAAEKLSWTWAYNPLKRAPALLPIDFVVTKWNPGYPAPLCQLNSIGAAAHRSYASASLCALFEVLERHSIMAWWYGLYDGQEILLEDAPADVMDLRNRIEEHGYSLIALDTSPWPEITLCLVIVENPSRRVPYVAFGAGASVSPWEAIRKALTEAVINLVASAEMQDGPLPTLSPQMTPRDHSRFYANSMLWFDIRNELLPSRTAPVASRINSRLSDTETLVSIAVILKTSVSADVLLVNLAPEAVTRRGLYAVRAVVPQLFPMCFGQGQQRMGKVRNRLSQQRLKLCLTTIPPFA